MWKLKSEFLCASLEKSTCPDSGDGSGFLATGLLERPLLKLKLEDGLLGVIGTKIDGMEDFVSAAELLPGIEVRSSIGASVGDRVTLM